MFLMHQLRHYMSCSSHLCHDCMLCFAYKQVRDYMSCSSPRRRVCMTRSWQSCVTEFHARHNNVMLFIQHLRDNFPCFSHPRYVQLLCPNHQRLCQTHPYHSATEFGVASSTEMLPFLTLQFAQSSVSRPCWGNIVLTDVITCYWISPGIFTNKFNKTNSS